MGRAETQWLSIGRIAGVFGLRGDLKIEPLTDFPERFEQLEHVYVGPSRQAYRVERTHPHRRHILVKLEGVDTPEAASILCREEIEIPREQAVELPEGHYFLADLIGVAVVTVEGETVGSISDVLRTGSNDVYVVGRGNGEILIPATRDAIRRLDLVGKRVLVESWVLEPQL